jgi:hypothetical protein
MVWRSAGFLLCIICGPIPPQQRRDVSVHDPVVLCKLACVWFVRNLRLGRFVAESLSRGQPPELEGEPIMASIALSSHLDALHAKHAGLETRLREEMARPIPDTGTIQSLKKQKLRLKEEITRA